MDRSIVIIGEHAEGRVAPTTFELLGLAREINQIKPFDIRLAILGSSTDDPARELAEATGETVLACEHPDLTAYHGEIYKDLLSESLPDLNPAFVLISQTTQGMDFGPGLAVRLGAGCISGVMAVSSENSGICFSRVACNGKIVEDVAPLVEPTVLLVQPGAFKAPSFEKKEPGSVTVQRFSATGTRTRHLGIRQVKQEDAGLAEADVIVSAGRGIGKAENLGLIRKLAALFARSAVAGSRPVCDMGWLPYERQIGYTGTVVNPDLYIACGISGAYHHRIGMQNSRFIVAISTDPTAPIFNIADVCICEDLKRFIPAFIEECEKEKISRPVGQLM